MELESANLIAQRELLGLAIELGARSVDGWSKEEEKLSLTAIHPAASLTARVRRSIRIGHDSLGETFSQLYSAEQRRPMGAVYTPKNIVSAMLKWAKRRLTPDRIVDAGTGSGRFLVASGRSFKDAQLIGVEFDPYAAILARGHVAAAGLAERSKIILGDYREKLVKPIDGRTLFIGNPPYVRHHLIGPEWKKWLQETAKKFKHGASGLAGLHAYFFLATAEFAKEDDVGVLITSAEWLDVNYGSIVRDLFLGHLGGSSLHVIEPTALPFPDTAATGVITGFTVGSKPKSIVLQRVESTDELGALETGRLIRRERLETAHRWTPLTHATPEKREDFVELGEICRVHRGQVTGANQIWIAGLYAAALPDSVLYPTVTRARELFASKGVLADDSFLRRVIDIPAELDLLSLDDRRDIENYLQYAKQQGADTGYVASHRKKWWAVGLREPAPILATYMARRPPMFVRNMAEARHINIAHGLYPRDLLTDRTLCRLAEFLSQSVSVTQGRTYAGGLTKFEPREMERLMVPEPDVLERAQNVKELLS
ncbi:MAG: class I SAM-dependent methyltransferase [Blastocatellia bacterium]|nr:class I SAM-dependent methyltransferase [Blastocatellia bacterium]